jgi:hypothetical protein
MTVNDIVPSIASPVLKTNLTMTIANFPATLTKSDLSANLVLQTDTTKVRPLNIIDIDNVNKKLVVRYGGAPSGIYNIVLTSKAYGNFDATSL